MNELTQFINQKEPDCVVKPPHRQAFIICLYLIKSVGIDDCFFAHVQVPIFITNDPKCNNIVILYNSCWEVLSWEVRAVCRVPGSPSYICSTVSVLLKGTFLSKEKRLILNSCSQQEAQLAARFSPALRRLCFLQRCLPVLYVHFYD